MSNYQGLLVDLDGTVYFKGHLIHGAVECLRDLKEKGVAVRYLTNTAGKPKGKIIQRLRNYGLEVEDEELFNPISVARTYFQQHENLSYYVAASEEIRTEFLEGNYDEKQPDIVVLGDLQKACSYDELNRIFKFLSEGSRLFTTSYSPYFYSSQGEKVLDTGAFTRMFETTLDIKADVLGKPSFLFYDMAVASTSLNKESCIAVGDDIETDILGANTYGVYSVLVQTGKYNEDAVKKSPITPDKILPSLADIGMLFG